MAKVSYKKYVSPVGGLGIDIGTKIADWWKSGFDTMYGTNMTGKNTPKNTQVASNNLIPINTSDVLNEYSSSNASSGYGGGGRTDLSNIFASLEQGAQSQRDIAKQTYENTRSDLLTSLKRFQEENARDVANQQKAYLSNQASLESAIAQADRQNRISAASKGLSGSGLQQLAQLQNLLSQGQQISNMATENQGVMDTLRRALAEKEADTETAQSRALETYNNTLNKIASDLAMNKANMEFQANENALNRSASAASNAAYQEQANKEMAGSLSQYIKNSQNKLANALSDINNAKTSKLKNMKNPYTGLKYETKDKNTIRQALYNAAEYELRDTLGNTYGIGEGTTTSNAALANLATLLQNSKIY